MAAIKQRAPKRPHIGRRANDRIMEQWAQDYVTNTMKKVSKKINSDINKTNNDIARELKFVYSEIIYDFYSYHTKRYIRNGEKHAGTETGWTLYQGINVIVQNSKMNHHTNGGQNLYVAFEYPDDAWTHFNTPEPKYQNPLRENPQEVLDNVVAGYRYKSPDDKHGRTLTYNFSSSLVTGPLHLWKYRGGDTLNDLLDSFNLHFDTIAQRAFDRHWDITKEHLGECVKS